MSFYLYSKSIYGFSLEGAGEHSSNGIFLKWTGLVEIDVTIPSPNDHREDICSVNVADTSGAGTAGIDSTATAIESYTVPAMSSFVGKVNFTNSIVQVSFHSVNADTNYSSMPGYFVC